MGMSGADDHQYPASPVLTHDIHDSLAELLWFVQRGGIEMNFALIMFCLKRHWRATRITEKAFNALR